jgi:glycosyltransferase involved in cell wall biosynthesis
MATIATARVGESGLEGRRFAALRRRLNGQFDLFLAVSGEIEAELRSDGVSPARIVRLPFFVDPDQFHVEPPERRAAWRALTWPQWPADALVVLAMNRLEERKGMATLVRAAAGLDRGLPWRVAIAGDGDQRAELEALIATLGLTDRVRLIGTVKDRVRHLNAADVFVLPSRYEGLPNGVLEALACGVPVAVSRIAGTTDIVDDQHALLAPPDDPAAWTAALDRLLRDAPLRARLAAAGPPHVQARYGAPAVIDRYADVCARLLAAPSDAPAP